MDVDRDSSSEIADEPQQQQQQRQQQQQQRQQRAQLEQHEVVPSSEMSIDDTDNDNDDGNGTELTTTIADNGDQLQSADIPSIDVNDDDIQSIRSNSIESQSTGAATPDKTDSDTESESRLIIHQSENETNDSSDANTASASVRASAATTATATAIKENGGAASLLIRANNKRKASDDLVDSDTAASDSSDDDEDFEGFTASDITRTEESSDLSKFAEAPVVQQSKTIEITIEEKQAIDDTMNNTPTTVHDMTPPKSSEKPAHFITTDPRYRKPFQFGWRREFVLRANVDSKTKADNKGEVYYHTPNGKKLRSKSEIQAELKNDANLDIGDFTFAKETIGMTPEQEIVRSAKVQTVPQRKPPPLPVEVPEVLGKRIRKPKMPKGASPPPPSTSANNKSRLSLSGKRQPEREVVEIIQAKAAKPTSKNSREACSIQCVLAMGMIPQLQCKKCQFMYHHECIGKDVTARIGNYICEHCVRERSEAAQATASNTSTPATANRTDTPNTSNLTRPKDAAPKQNTSILSTPIRTTGGNAANKQKDSKNTSTILGTPTMSQILTTPTLAPTTPATAASAAVQPNEADTKTPQSIAIVAGRKYIMVPKTSEKIINGVETAKSSSGKTSPVVSAPAAGAQVGNVFAHASPSTHTLFASEFFNNVSRGYDILLNVFQYLKVQELLRASSVCRMWNHVANNSILWSTVRMKNSQVSDWGGLMTALRRHGTRDLDLRKILIPSSLDWNDFVTHIGRVPDLETLHLCRCPTEVVTALLETNTNLRSLNALSLIGRTIEFPTQCKLTALTELRLKSGSSISVGTLDALRNLPALRHLSLTSIKDLDATKLEPLITLASLESLELGECTNLNGNFARNILLRLTKVKRLRLENGKEKCATFDILDTVEKLTAVRQLELVNFDIRPGFDARIAACKQLKRVLLIPTYISQSATTNNLILSTIARLGPLLQSFTWVVTQELIRVTDLYTDDCHTDSQTKKPSEDKIPVIKPVPMMTDVQKTASANDSNPQLVEILPLSRVDKIVQTAIPGLKLKIVKVPFSATWRQTITDNL